MAAPNPRTPTVAAAQAVVDNRSGVRSKEATSIADTLLRAPVPVRRAALKTLNGQDLAHVLAEVERETGTLYGLWQDTPSGRLAPHLLSAGPNRVSVGSAGMSA